MSEWSAGLKRWKRQGEERQYVWEKRGCCEELMGRSDSRDTSVCTGIIGRRAGFKVLLTVLVPVPPIEA